MGGQVGVEGDDSVLSRVPRAPSLGLEGHALGGPRRVRGRHQAARSTVALIAVVQGSSYPVGPVPLSDRSPARHLCLEHQPEPPPTRRHAGRNSAARPVGLAAGVRLASPARYALARQRFAVAEVIHNLALPPRHPVLSRHAGVDSIRTIIVYSSALRIVRNDAPSSLLPEPHLQVSSTRPCPIP